MLGVDEICIIVVYMEEVHEHTENKARNGHNFSKGTEAQLSRNGNKEGNGQYREKYPPFFTPGWHDNGHEDRNSC